MDKRNFKKPEQPDRKPEKEDMGDIKKVEKQLKRTVDSDTNYGRLHPERGDLKKAEKKPKRGIDLDTSDPKVSPGREDLKRLDKQSKKVLETHADRGDLKKTDKQAKKVIILDTSESKISPDRGDLKKTEKQPKKVVESHADRGDLKKQVLKVVDLVTNDTKLPPDRGDLRKTEKQSKKVIETHAEKGELKKTDRQVKKVIELNTNDSKLHPDRGDSGRKTTKVDKPKLNVMPKKSDDKTKNTEHTSKDNVKKLNTEAAKAIPDDNQKLKDKFNLKLKKSVAAPPSVNKKEDQPKMASCLKLEAKNDRTQKKPNDAAKDKSDESNESKQSVNMIKPEKRDSIQRKPIIRTISSRNDKSKIYKAVTFVDQKRNKPTVLIKIPNETAKHPKKMKSTETLSVKKVKLSQSGDSVKEKTHKKSDRKKRDRSRHVTSPDVTSPPTEVAKWAPSSINRHTKPYYEAWVNTTLAVISKNSKKDKLFYQKQNVLQSFQRALAERPETPELVYENFNDERYTGKIKVKQR